MIHVDIMRFLVKLYKSGELGLIAELAKRWNADIESIKELRYSANAIFSFKNTRGTKILRISYEKEKHSAKKDWRERNKGMLQDELQVIMFLREKGILTPEPLKSINGDYIESIETEQGIFYATVFNYIKGKLLDVDELSLEQIKKWGELVATYHSLMTRFPLKLESRRNHVEDAELLVRELEYDKEDQVLKHRASGLTQWMKSLKILPDNYGLIHYDFCSDNIIWDEAENPWLIDFDDITYHFYTADIGFILEDMIEDDRGEIVFKTFIDAYSSIKPLCKNYAEEIHKFMELSEILKYARLRRSYRNYSVIDMEEWFIKMRDMHFKKLKDTRNKMEKFKMKLPDNTIITT